MFVPGKGLIEFYDGGATLEGRVLSAGEVSEYEKMLTGYQIAAVMPICNYKGKQLEYDFIEFEHKSTDIRTQEEDAAVNAELKELLADAQFVVSDYRKMWPIECVTGIDQGHRGPIIRLSDNTYTWWYNILGVYRLEK